MNYSPFNHLRFKSKMKILSMIKQCIEIYKNGRLLFVARKFTHVLRMKYNELMSSIQNRVEISRYPC